MKERKIYLDMLRTLCCIAVIITHVFTTARTDFSGYSSFEKVISYIIPNLFHFAVPIFLMITGSLFLNKKIEPCKEYLKKYVFKYILAIIVFAYFFAMLENVFKHNFNLIIPFKTFIDVLEGKTWNHMWYLYELIGIMLLLPIIKIILDKNEKYLKYLLSLSFISAFVFPFVSTFFGINIGVNIDLNSPYLTYTMIGYFVSKQTNKNKKVLYINILTILLMVIIITICTIYSFDDSLHFIDKLNYFGQYNSITILILSIAIFSLFKNKDNWMTNKILTSISNNSYGIYIIHMLFINLIYKFLKFDIYGNMFFLKALLVFIVVLIFSNIFTYIAKKIPIINRIL